MVRISDSCAFDTGLNTGQGRSGIHSAFHTFINEYQACMKVNWGFIVKLATHYGQSPLIAPHTQRLQKRQWVPLRGPLGSAKFTYYDSKNYIKNSWKKAHFYFFYIPRSEHPRSLKGYQLRIKINVAPFSGRAFDMSSVTGLFFNWELCLGRYILIGCLFRKTIAICYGRYFENVYWAADKCWFERLLVVCYIVVVSIAEKLGRKN